MAWAVSKDPPSKTGRDYVAFNVGPFADHAQPRMFELRDGVWYCEHLAMPEGFDRWDDMVARGWRRVEVGA
jgi:hypothetical protein